MANELQEIQFEYKAFRQLEREANRAKGTSEYDAKCADVNSAAYGLALDVPKLIDEVERLQTALDAVTRERDDAVAARRLTRKQLMETRDALTPFAKAAEWIGLHVGGEMERRIVSVTGCTTYDWKRAQDIMAHEVADVAEQAARQHDDAAERSPETGGG